MKTGTVIAGGVANMRKQGDTMKKIGWLIVLFLIVSPRIVSDAAGGWKDVLDKTVNSISGSNQLDDADIINGLKVLWRSEPLRRSSWPARKMDTSTTQPSKFPCLNPLPEQKRWSGRPAWETSWMPSCSV